MRLVKSIDVSVSRAAGSSPLAPVFLRDTVGSDSSSATNGSSVASVAGKKRLPAKPWANAPLAAAQRSAPASTGNVLMCFLISSFRGLRRARSFLAARAAWRTAAAVRLTAEGSGKDRRCARRRGGVEREERRSRLAPREDSFGRRDRVDRRGSRYGDRRAALGAEGAEVAVRGVIALVRRRGGAA